MKVVRIAVTGGPCGGKTTVLDEVRKQFGNQILVSPEVASLLLDNGFPRPGRDMAYTDAWSDYFQKSVLPVQENMENAYCDMALERSTRVVLYDRGMLDGAAYLGRGLEYFVDRFGLNLPEVLSRYDAVLHLESVAVHNAALYEQLKSTNPARYETAQQAVERDRGLYEVWSDHPNHQVVSAALSMKDKVRTVTRFLSRYLSTEIEVKYLLSKVPGKILADYDKTAVEIDQGYLTSGIRLRRMGNEHYLTIKGEGTYARAECERLIDEWAFDLLWPDTESRRVEKVRYFIPHGKFTLELDMYMGELSGLMTLECEFQSESQIKDFVLPDWAADAVDVTTDKAYSNFSLAFRGLPTTK